MRRESFGDHVNHAIILCYKEDVTPLVTALEIEGITAKTQRAVYSDQERTYSLMSRCFLNHAEAWKAASQCDGYTLICESDFVPCCGLRDYPVFWPATDDYAWAYLYQGSPRLLALLGPWPFFLRGHTAPLVAYVINRKIAEILLEFCDHIKTDYDLTQYFTFDAFLQWYVMGKGGRAFMPWRHYGEHGGLPNPEHLASRQVSAAGRHHADNLMGPLHFLPPYARGSMIEYWKVRARWRALGLARLLTRRWIIETNVYSFSRTDIIRMYAVGLLRLMPRLPSWLQRHQPLSASTRPPARNLKRRRRGADG